MARRARIGPGSARRAAPSSAAARDAGFEVAPISNYCRSARLSGLVVGFGGVTDAELDRVLDAISHALSPNPGRSEPKQAVSVRMSPDSRDIQPGG